MKASRNGSAPASGGQQRARIEKRVNDRRPKIELPGSRNRLLSEFGAEIGSILARHSFFRKDGIVVTPNAAGDGLTIVSGRAFRTAIERFVVPFRIFRFRDEEVCSFNRTMTKEHGESLLECPQLIEKVP
jgi:hypothetical protein